MVQQLAKKRPQDIGSARILAKELVRAKKQRQRMYQSKATLNSVQMQLQEQIGTHHLGLLWFSNVQDKWDIETEYRSDEGCQFFGQNTRVKSGYATILNGVDKGSLECLWRVWFRRA
jgi:hypothetical protein